MDEKRNSGRVRHSQPVRFEFPELNRFGNCLSKDLSEGGIRIHLNGFIPLNTKLTLKIRLVGENVAHCIGRVAWIEKDRFGESYQAGLEFSSTDSTLNQRQQISEFLSHQ